MVMNPSTNELVTFLASRNVFDGILHEPRLYTQLFDFSDPTTPRPLASDDAVFRNGEQYPVRITHLVAAIRDAGPALQPPASSDPRLVQRVGVRLMAHDTYYMSPDFVLLPLFHNKVVAASDVVTRALSSWSFDKPVFMGGRDGFEVKVALEYPVDAVTEVSLRAWVTFHGVGAISRRPKQLSGWYDFTAADGTAIRSIPIEFYRNDGTEPLEVTEITVHLEAPSGLAGSKPDGNIRRLKLSVRQSGNGTNQRWTSTPPLDASMVPASLWGITTGRCVVHELPANDDGYPGWLWYPNEGLTVEVQPAPGVNVPVYVGLAGHIVVK
jgi:hypothetical protein